jgi:hypothetical protein
MSAPRHLLALVGEHAASNVVRLSRCAEKGPSSIAAKLLPHPDAPETTLMVCLMRVAQHCHNRGAGFFDEQDYHAYPGWLGDAPQRDS